MADDKGRFRGEDGGFVERALDGILPEIITRSVVTGIRNVFATREGFRKVAESVPKEAVGFVRDQLVGLRQDVFSVLSTEVRAFLSRVSLGHELQRALTALSLQVTMEVRFIPTDNNRVRPSVTGSVRPRRRRGQRAAATADDTADDTAESA